MLWICRNDCLNRILQLRRCLCNKGTLRYDTNGLGFSQNADYLGFQLGFELARIQLPPDFRFPSINHWYVSLQQHNHRPHAGAMGFVAIKKTQKR